ncbi:MAG TPA: transporter substrate-binding domain-containing protein [Alphaproteobacteria bacterium]|nr:transporter substrate-binding domain-containing protein [Alphaproteobacteria bacterium]
MTKQDHGFLGRLFRPVAAFLAVTLLAAAAPSAWAESVLDEAKARGELVLGTELQYAPFEFTDNGKPVGYSVDLMDLVAADLGVKLRYVDIPFASVLPGLDAKKFDMVEATSTITKARMERYYFTLPIADATVALVKRKGDSSVMKPQDIAGKIVGGTKGSAQTKLLQDYVQTLPGGVQEIKEYIGSPNAYADLEAGRIVAVAGSLPNLAYLVKTRPQSFELVLPPFGPKAYLAWLARKDDASKPLIDAIDASLLKLTKSGKIKELQLKWFGVAVELPTDGVPAPLY